jgi:hypothetical protein
MQPPIRGVEVSSQAKLWSRRTFGGRTAAAASEKQCITFAMAKRFTNAISARMKANASVESGSESQRGELYLPCR